MTADMADPNSIGISLGSNNKSLDAYGRNDKGTQPALLHPPRLLFDANCNVLNGVLASLRRTHPAPLGTKCW